MDYSNTDPSLTYVSNSRAHKSNSDATRNSSQTMQVAQLCDKLSNPQEVKEFRQQMLEQDARHRESIDEIQSIIDDVLAKEGEEMRNQVKQDIADEINELVKEHVARCLQNHIPEDLQQELVNNTKEHEDLQRALHNSDSRRLNGSLRANKPDDALNTIYLPNSDDVSPNFPKDLNELFSLDGPSLDNLMAQYGFAQPGKSRDANLNKFMHFVGVKYQMVAKPEHPKSDHNNSAM